MTTMVIKTCIKCGKKFEVAEEVNCDGIELCVGCLLWELMEGEEDE